MKKIVTISFIASTLLLTGCAQRIADFTLASTKNVNLNNGHFVEGPRVVGEDTKAIFIVPLGVPSIKEASDNAIEQDRCAVGLTDVAADSEFFSFLVGYVKYKIEGNLLIDKSKPGCESWK
ncbi:hypothetical protein [Photobacterium kishitanii]|uniref:hypothetical protein n=1 Tax=Photobacterium kishitanii TaxID=318456 RepID=UPI000435A7B9|nr:hypothetical protein [Photobacterium kishitanii]CEO39373.1 conserved exported hypothetical protein [Photobacterium kishitanii]